MTTTTSRPVAIKVVDASGGSWIQVEAYENPMDLFALQVATGMAAGEKPRAEREKRMKDAPAELRKSVQLKWINLNQATSIFKTPDEAPGVMKEF